MTGIIVYDKEAGVTSAAAVAAVKRIAAAKKAGHTGTLDPMATGLLIICMGRATRLSRFFLNAPKTYRAALTLGRETDTQDAFGQTIRETPVTLPLSEAVVKNAFDAYRGDIEQIPPAISALKHKGKPLYRWAREGRPVIKPARQVRIDQLDIDFIQGHDIGFTVRCSSGTYIRTLCADIGRDMGFGGHMTRLRRIETGGFSECDGVTRQALAQAKDQGDLHRHILDPESALRGVVPRIVADDEMARRVQARAPITRTMLRPHGTRGGVMIVDHQGKAIALMIEQENTDTLTYAGLFRTERQTA